MQLGVGNAIRRLDTVLDGEAGFGIKSGADQVDTDNKGRKWGQSQSAAMSSCRRRANNTLTCKKGELAKLKKAVEVTRTCKTSEVHERPSIFLECFDDLFQGGATNDIVQSLWERCFKRSCWCAASSHELVGFDCMPTRLANGTIRINGIQTSNYNAKWD